MMKTKHIAIRHHLHAEDGRSLVETIAVCMIAALLLAFTVPQVINARRLMRSVALPREVAAQLRFARQQAMSQRQAFTFQYNDVDKKIRIIDHQASGPAVLSAAGYPNTTGSVIVLEVPLAYDKSPVPIADFKYGVPSGITNSNLSDGTSMTALSSNTVNVTFQPDGSVVDANGNAVNRSLYFYNNRVQKETAAAVSVLGTAGRVKVWRYNRSANQYQE